MEIKIEKNIIKALAKIVPVKNKVGSLNGVRIEHGKNGVRLTVACQCYVFTTLVGVETTAFESFTIPFDEFVKASKTRNPSVDLFVPENKFSKYSIDGFEFAPLDEMFPIWRKLFPNDDKLLGPVVLDNKNGMPFFNPELLGEIVKTFREVSKMKNDYFPTMAVYCQNKKFMENNLILWGPESHAMLAPMVLKDLDFQYAGICDES